MKCTADDCDQVHCKNCGCHTIGNTLRGGLCQDCFQFEEDEYEREQRMDKYDEAVRYFQANPERIAPEWNDAIIKSNLYPHANALFGAVARDPCNNDFGCLSQVKANVWSEAEDSVLTHAIKSDPEIPSSSGTDEDGTFGIKVEHLPIFAAWRRRIDKYFETGEL